MGKHQQRDRIAKLISWGHWFTFSNILLCLAIGILYLESARTGGSVAAISYLALSWIGHFAFLPFVFFILLLFPLCILVPYSRILRGYAAIVASVGVFTLLFDAVFFSQYGFHLNTYALTQITTDLEAWFAGASFIMLIASIFVFLVIFGIELVFANLTWKKLESLQRAKFTKPVTALFVASFLLSHIVHIWADATLVRPITQQDDLFPLSYPTTAKTLMARHGWIDTETFQAQRSRLTADELAVRYPVSPLLCAKEPAPPVTLIVAFDQFNHAQQHYLEEQSDNLREWQGTMLGHPDLSAATFQLTYGVPDIYQLAILQRNLPPAYEQTLEDFAEELSVYRTEGFSADMLPHTLESNTHTWTTDSNYYRSVNIIFASTEDADVVLPAIKRALQSPGHQLLITGLKPANSMNDLNTDSPANRLSVPLWYSGLSMHPTHRFATLEDIMATTLSRYMSCAENFRSFTNGQRLTRSGKAFPRVLSVEPRIFIFEESQQTVLDRNGDFQVFDNEGNRIPEAAPATPVLIQSLSELQRFSRN